MRIIAHRGNINGPDEAYENHPDRIKEALQSGFEVEVDVWYHNSGSFNDGLFLGHDKPQYRVNIDFLLDPRIWCHAKNLHGLEFLRRFPDCHYFWHEEDTVTLTSQNYVWTYPGKPLIENSVIVMPEKASPSYIMPSTKVIGVCTDYPWDYSGYK